MLKYKREGGREARGGEETQFGHHGLQTDQGAYRGGLGPGLEDRRPRHLQTNRQQIGLPIG